MHELKTTHKFWFKKAIENALAAQLRRISYAHGIAVSMFIATSRENIFFSITHLGQLLAFH